MKLKFPQGSGITLSGDDRVVVRVYGPGIPEVKGEFTRSEGTGVLNLEKFGADMVVKVDEYDSAGKLVARGFAYGLDLSGGGDVTVDLLMVPKGWVITLAGGISGGPSPDGTFARDLALSSPSGVEWSGGELYVVDEGNQELVKIDKYFKSWHVKTFSDSVDVQEGGSFVDSSFMYPLDFIIKNSLIYFLCKDSTIIETDLSSIISIPYYEIMGIAIQETKNRIIDVNSSGELFMADYNQNKIYKIVNGGKISYVEAGSNPLLVEGANRVNYGLNGPSGIYIDNFTLFFSDEGNNKVKYVSNDGVFTYIGSEISSSYYEGVNRQEYNVISPGFIYKWGGSFIVYEKGFNRILISRNDSLFLMAQNGSSTDILQPLPPDAAGLNDPRDVAVDDEGNVYIADYGNNAVRMAVGAALD